MSFIADKQTLDDLNLLGKFRPFSIFSIFNKVITNGGERLLESMFRHPLKDHEMIGRRADVFSYFKSKAISFPSDPKTFTRAEDFLMAGISTNILTAYATFCVKFFKHRFLRDNECLEIRKGIVAISEVFSQFNEFLADLAEDADNPQREKAISVRTIFANKVIQRLSSNYEEKKMNWWVIMRYEYLLKKALRTEMDVFLEYVYELDVFISVGRVAREKNFTIPKVLPAEMNVLNLFSLRHPGLRDGVVNSLTFNGSQNMIFLTGANMAGKSTLMKSVGVAVYLAHMGFPVAAENMEFSVRDGLYTSINVSDDISLGYSHFYAEVVRVKQAAVHVSAKKRMLVMFDELFKGTNVKDAYDATLAITEAFALYLNCFFIVSTHITEVGHSLQNKYSNLQFCFMPTIMNGKIPAYPYKLTMGITSDRHGMMIIKNEGILELLATT